MSVSNEKWEAALARLRTLGVDPNALREEFTRSGGHGGQNVNKVSTCVLLTDPASGISVRCQEERTQGMNRYRARVRLADKLEERILGEKSRARMAIEKIRRQKRKRSKRAKEKLLADKHRQSAKKSARGPVRGED